MNRWWAVVIILILSGASACTTPSTPAPERDFTTSDVLITPDQLRWDWNTISGPSELPFNAIGYRNNLGGSMIELKRSTISIAHIVTKFSNERDAVIAYKDHNHTGTRNGRYPISWHEAWNWEYSSPIAGQFRVVCTDVEGVQKIGDRCIIEAQYDEFLSIVIYNNINPGRTTGDLETIAMAVDEKMEELLGS